jgi:four helix bundle protein
MYGVTSQLRRAAVSVLANIVEGQAKPTRKDFRRYLNISKGSIRECEFFLELSKDLGYLGPNNFDKLNNLQNRTAFLLYKLICSLR